MTHQDIINRGEKWYNVRRLCVAKGQTKKVEWMNSQESIVNDIKVYEDFLKIEEEAKAKEPDPDPEPDTEAGE